MVPYGIKGFYVGPAFKHYRCYDCWISSTQKIQISDCIKWFPRGISMPSATPLEKVFAAAKNLITASIPASLATSMLCTNYSRQRVTLPLLQSSSLTPPQIRGCQTAQLSTFALPSLEVQPKTTSGLTSTCRALTAALYATSVMPMSPIVPPVDTFDVTPFPVPVPQPSLMVYISPGCSSGVPRRNEWAGGVTLIVCKRVFTGWTVNKLYSDPSGYAMYLAADLHHLDGRRARVMDAYIPLESSSSVPSTPWADLLSSVPPPSASPVLLSSVFPAGPKLSASDLATKGPPLSLLPPSLPLSPKRPSTAEAWFWHRYEILSRNLDWEIILVGGFGTQRGAGPPTFRRPVPTTV
jgi:hypothetical protein